MIEVERRTNYKFDVPREAVLKKSCKIEDCYYSIYPFYKRLRTVEIDFPNKDKIRFYSEKRRGQEILEIEFPLSLEAFERFEERLNNDYKGPLFKVSGYRQEYIIESMEGLVICFDKIDQLGEWREAEIMVKEESKIKEALCTIYSVFRSFGVPEDSIISETYPEMLYGKIYELNRK